MRVQSKFSSACHLLSIDNSVVKYLEKNLLNSFLTFTFLKHRTLKEVVLYREMHIHIVLFLFALENFPFRRKHSVWLWCWKKCPQTKNKTYKNTIFSFAEPDSQTDPCIIGAINYGLVRDCFYNPARWTRSARVSWQIFYDRSPLIKTSINMWNPFSAGFHLGRFLPSNWQSPTPPPRILTPLLESESLADASSGFDSWTQPVDKRHLWERFWQHCTRKTCPTTCWPLGDHPSDHGNRCLGRFWCTPDEMSRDRQQERVFNRLSMGCLMGVAMVCIHPSETQHYPDSNYCAMWLRSILVTVWSVALQCLHFILHEFCRTSFSWLSFFFQLISQLLHISVFVDR